MLKKLLQLKKRLETGIYQDLAVNQQQLDSLEDELNKVKTRIVENRVEWRHANLQPQTVSRHQTRRALGIYHAFYLKETENLTLKTTIQKRIQLTQDHRSELKEKLRHNHIEQEKLRYLIERDKE